jgi:dTDP-4-amino-4,6-dideoxygalactose transaminase
MGRHAAEFERLFAAFCGAPLALGCANGTAALELICRALDVAGGSVAVPANTFMATALAPIAAGARIIVVDCEPRYFQMCPDALERAMRPDTKAVILAHIGGFISPAWERIRDICEARGAAFIEDAAHAHGAEASGARAGTLGRAAAFSFFPTKVLTTAEGGMVTTADPELHAAMAAIRQHGQERPGSNIHERFGLKYRPSEIHALLGLAMMKKADWILRRRREAAAVYDDLLNGTALSPVHAPAGHRPAYYKYMALLPEGLDRAALKERLKSECRISLAGEVYAHCLGGQPIWAAHPEYLAGPLPPLPVSREVARRQICLPLYPGITVEMQEYVVENLLCRIKT